MKKIIKTYLFDNLVKTQGLKIASIISIVIFALGLLSSSALYNVARSQYNADFQTKINRQAYSITNHILEKNAQYEQSLLAGTGLFRVIGADSLSANNWRRFVTSLEFENRAPETMAIGFSQYVPASEVSAFEKGMQQEGFIDYKVTPDDKRDEYTAIKYVEPSDTVNQSALGYDMFTEPARRDAMERARDTARPAITAPVVARRDQGRENVLSALIYYPLYSGTEPETVEQRRESLEGYVFIAYRMNDMVGRIAQNEGDLEFSINDITNGQRSLLYSNQQNDNDAEQQLEQELQVAGRLWQVSLAYNDRSFNRLIGPTLLFIGAALLSLVLAVIMFLILNKRFWRVENKHEIELQKTKDELLALASHQLRTPATSARQYLGMLTTGYFGELTKEQEDIAQKAYLSNERQLEVIDQMLYVAKADSGQLLVQPEKLNISKLTIEIIEDFSDVAKKKQIRIDFDTPKHSIYCEADERYARMIIENLLSNAIKYSYEKSVIIVRLQARYLNVALTIQDSGVGVADDDLSRLFQKFSRINNPLSQKEGGSGLGLFLAKKLAEAHGGDITINSTVKKGSTFTLLLPKRITKLKNVVRLTE